MQTSLLILHLLIALAIIGLVLLQRSEGGALGMGGGGAGFMSGRGAANILTRLTTILGIGFFLTSIALTLLARYGEERPLLDAIPEERAEPILPIPPAPDPAETAPK